MSALTDALAAVLQVHDNEQALADPVAVSWDAEIAFKQAVVAALEGLSTALEALSTINTAEPAQFFSSIPASAEQNSLAQLQAENAALTAKVAAGEQAIAAFDAVLHPADAATMGNVSAGVPLQEAAQLSPAASSESTASQQASSPASAAPEAPTIAPSNAGV